MFYNFKRISNDLAKRNVIVEMLKLIIGDVQNYKVYRTRKVWSRKRSPHVFSKSQESFGYQVYIGNLNIKTLKPQTNPIEILDVIKCLSHIVPGISWNWISHK